MPGCRRAHTPILCVTGTAETWVSRVLIPLQELMGSIPGMEVFAFTGTHRALLHDVITKRLNRNLREFWLRLLCAFAGGWRGP